MKRNLFNSVVFVFLAGCSLYACAQEQKPVGQVRQHQHTFGSAVVVVRETSYATGIPVQFLQLHSNETTANDVATSVSEELGIDYLQILNGNKRLIEFNLESNQYRFDPNRIFSTPGIVASLQRHSRYTDKAFQTIFSFRDFLLGLIDSRKTIVALHNNTDGDFSLAEYQKNETGLVHSNTLHDPDDFFITTDSVIFRLLKEKGFNVVLEFREKLKDDGSLSIYSSLNKLRYVNIEAEHGHQKEQDEMLRVLIRILRDESAGKTGAVSNRADNDHLSFTVTTKRR